jgi:hypothetical protein
MFQMMNPHGLAIDDGFKLLIYKDHSDLSSWPVLVPDIHNGKLRILDSAKHNVVRHRYILLQNMTAKRVQGHGAYRHIHP